MTEAHSELVMPRISHPCVERYVGGNSCVAISSSSIKTVVKNSVAAGEVVVQKPTLTPQIELTR